jgi:hypothetical protein
MEVVQNLHQEVKMQNNRKDRIVSQRKLRFEEEEIWAELPEPTQENCRALLRQLMKCVLGGADRSSNERED